MEARQAPGMGYVGQDPGDDHHCPSCGVGTLDAPRCDDLRLVLPAARDSWGVLVFLQTHFLSGVDAKSYRSEKMT